MVCEGQKEEYRIPNEIFCKFQYAKPFDNHHLNRGAVDD